MTTESPPKPLQVVPYFSDDLMFLSKLIRTLASVFLLVSVLHLVAMGIFVLNFRPWGRVIPSWYTSVFFTLGLTQSILAVVGSAACWRKKPRGRLILQIWAWCALGAIVCSLGFSTYSELFVRARTLQDAITSMLTFGIDQFAGEAGVAIACLILLSQPEIRRIFSERL